MRVSGVEAELNYLARSSILNRRYVAPGAELNTGHYEQHRVFIRNARAADEDFSLDCQGFVLAQHHSAVTDFKDKAEVEARYPGEVEQLVRRLTGADYVVPLGWVVRTSGATTAAVQPPASDVHVDMTHARAQRLARNLFASAVSAESGFRRFIASSLWRTFSAPPQDWPLALCDARSVEGCEGLPNTMVRVPVLPALDAIPAILPDEETLPAAAVFHFNPRHRWWYFPHMTRDEVILLKLHDSDHERAWRVPHSAFRDPTCAPTTVRESIEFRTVAYFR